MSDASQSLPEPEVTHKDIPGHPGYRAASNGTIWSCWGFQGAGHARKCKQVKKDRWRQLKPCRRVEDGRARYTLRREDGTYRRCYASALVLEAFVGPRPVGMEACHDNGDCLDDSAANLRWDTPTANKADMVDHGTRICGEDIPTAKLNERDVRIIRSLRASGIRLKAIAQAFEVTETLVSLIARKEIWRHV